MANSVIRKITQQQWITLKSETYNNILAILETVEVLIGHIGSNPQTSDGIKQMCAGLFSHAIEEYAKLLYLQSLQPINGIIEIEYDGKRGGKFKNHEFKFELALKKLPTRSTTLREGAFDPNIFDSHVFDTGTVADWDTRLDIFNTNFDNNGNVVHYPMIDFNTLSQAVSDYRTEMNRTTP